MNEKALKKYLCYYWQHRSLWLFTVAAFISLGTLLPSPANIIISVLLFVIGLTAIIWQIYEGLQTDQKIEDAEPADRITRGTVKTVKANWLEQMKRTGHADPQIESFINSYDETRD